MLYELLKTCAPSLSNRAFAVALTCADALHYQKLEAEKEYLSFAAFREDYDCLVQELTAIAQTHDWHITTEGYVTLRVSPSDSRSLCLYPLDELPQQLILRFRLFKEAQRSAGKEKSLKSLQRYNGQGSGVYAMLTAVADRNDSSSKLINNHSIFRRSILRCRIEPLRSAVLEGVTISIPQHADNWVLEMTEPRKKALSLIQQDELDILQEVDRVAQELNTPFFLVGGTQLGAVRDKSFIPWDDDLDLGMLRRDYTRFCKEGQRALSESYFIQLPSTDTHSNLVYARIRKKGKRYITIYNEGKNTEDGLWADLFPFDATPSNRIVARLHFRLANGFARLSMGFMRRREYAHHDSIEDVPFKADRSYLRRYRFFSRFFPVTLTQALYHFTARFFNPLLAGRKGTRYASFIPTYTTIESGELEPLQRVALENLNLPVIAGAHSFLERQYGSDYLEWPPLHKRESDHELKYLQCESGERIYV